MRLRIFRFNFGLGYRVRTEPNRECRECRMIAVFVLIHMLVILGFPSPVLVVCVCVCVCVCACNVSVRVCGGFHYYMLLVQ